MTILERIQNYTIEGRRQETLKTPYLSFLQDFGKYLFEQTKELNKINTNSDISTKLTSLKMSLDIYIADLIGELQHDYEKKLKRYPQKWLNEKRKLDSLKSQFVQVYIDIEEMKGNS